MKLWIIFGILVFFSALCLIAEQDLDQQLKGESSEHSTP